MRRQTVQKLLQALLMAGLLLSGMTAALAGGMTVTLELPPYSTDTKIKEAALMVKVVGCEDPKVWVATATAEGLVNGERKSIEIKTTKIKPGYFAIKPEWPTTGAWVLIVHAGYKDHPQHLVVPLGEKGKLQLTKGKNADGHETAGLVCKNYGSDSLRGKDLDDKLHEMASAK